MYGILHMDSDDDFIILLPQCPEGVSSIEVMIQGVSSIEVMIQGTSRKAIRKCAANFLSSISIYVNYQNQESGKMVYQEWIQKMIDKLRSDEWPESYDNNWKLAFEFFYEPEQGIVLVAEE